jgi:hypothetical protein
VQNIMSAVRLDMKEGLFPAISLLDEPALETYYRTFAILAVAKLGGKEHLPLLDPLLADETPCAEVNEGDKTYRPQVRDIALAAMIHITGQDPKAYGFDRIQPSDWSLFETSSITFSSRKKRNAAFAKWKEYQEQVK